MTTWVIFILLMILLYLFNTIKPAKFPPGPPHLVPYFGYLPILLLSIFHKHMKYLSSYYGPIIGIFVPHYTMVVLNSYELVKEALMNDDLAGRPRTHLFDSMKWFKDIGVIFSDGHDWQTQKRFTISQLRKLGFGKISSENIILAEVVEMIKIISEQNGKPIDLKNAISVSSVNIIWMTMGGNVLKQSDPKALELSYQIENLFRLGSQFGHVSNQLPFLQPFYRIRKRSSYNQMIDNATFVRSFIMESIEEHKQTLVEDDAKDFIDLYLIELKKGSPSFSEEQLTIILMETFIAGVDTSANVELFCILFMCLYPQCQQKAHQELDREVGAMRLPTNKDKLNLHYLNAFYNEIMRFRCPAPTTVPHEALRDTEIEGYHIPKGCLVIPNLYALFMDENYWKDPEVFRPSRFLDSAGKFMPEECLIPFSKGKRNCMGEPLAKMSTFLIVAGLLNSFNFTLGSLPSKDSAGNLGLTLRAPQFTVVATPRH